MVVKDSETRRRAIRKLGRSVTVTNYSDNGNKDEYGDPQFDKTTTDTQAIIQVDQDSEQRRGPEGSDTKDQYQVFLPDDVTVEASGERSDDGTKATELTDSISGKDFKVYHVFKHQDGVVECLARSK